MDGQQQEGRRVAAHSGGYLPLRCEVTGLLISDSRDPQKPVTILAERGVFVDSPGAARIVMVNGNRQQFDPDTRKLSLLSFESYTLDPLCQAVEAAWKAGIVVVVAAGNDGRNNTNGIQGYAEDGAREARLAEIRDKLVHGMQGVRAAALQK